MLLAKMVYSLFWPVFALPWMAMENVNPTEYIAINKALWAARTKHHINTEFYNMAAFRKGQSSLDEIAQTFLGEIDGREVLHLQCHFGQDTLSLARLGAKVTGVDFVSESIEQARSLSSELGIAANFICSDVYETAGKIASPADLVFTSYGVLGWLPDMHRWAQMVSDCLKPGGELLLIEFHPVVWMFESNFKGVQYSYFNQQTIIETDEHTYTDDDELIALPSVNWNHPLTDVMGALLDAGMDITCFREYNYSPYNCFNDMVEFAPGKYQHATLKAKLPMVYALKASKRLA